MKGHELSIFFDLKDASSRRYESQAWEVFMRYSDPEMLKNSELFHGEVLGLVAGAGHMFCIAVRSDDPKVIQYLKYVFAACTDPRLAPSHDRLRESEIVQKYQLKYRGKVDSEGRLVTEKWRRTDHDLCLATGWAYVPGSYPKHLSPNLIDELDRMSEAGPREASAKSSEPGHKAGFGEGGLRDFTTEWMPRLKKWGVASLVGVVLLCGWLVRDSIVDNFGSSKEALFTRFDLGSEAYARYKEGFALAGIAKIPHDLNLEELNEKLEERAYYVLQHKDESTFDVWADCMVWFASTVNNDPLPQTNVQAFIKINLKSLDGSPLWTCQSKGVRSSPGTEKQNPDLRYEALRAAIDTLDLSCLPDGRSVKSFQANNDFSGLRKHVQYLMDEHKKMMFAMQDNAAAGSEKSIESPEPVDPPVVPEPGEPAKSERAELQAKLRERLEGRWIMTNYVHLKTGKTLPAVILEERGPTVRLQLEGGKANIPRKQIEEIESFGKEQFAAHIEEILQPLRKDLQDEWQHAVCDDFVEEFTEKCVSCGPPLPHMCVVSIKPDEETGTLTAVVKTAKGRTIVKSGDRLDGFNVVGIDTETGTVLLKMGRNGEILRIWPET